MEQPGAAQEITQDDASQIQRLFAQALGEIGEDKTAQLLAAAVLVSGVAFYLAEKDSDGPITTLGDALWNAITTVSAHGESGCPPVTPAGRLVGSILILLGQPLYDKNKGEIRDSLAPSAGSPESGGRAPHEQELLTKLDVLIKRLNALAPAPSGDDPPAGSGS